MSPLKSQNQLKKFGELVKEGKMSQTELDKWIKDTPNIHNLPERVSSNIQVKRVKKAKVI